jgi:hypothetical protein
MGLEVLAASREGLTRTSMNQFHLCASLVQSSVQLVRVFEEARPGAEGNERQLAKRHHARCMSIAHALAGGVQMTCGREVAFAPAPPTPGTFAVRIDWVWRA